MSLSVTNIFSVKLKRDDRFKHLEESRKKKEFFDVQLQIGDKLFDAHQKVLEAYSPVLKAMISDQWSTTKICPISAEYVDPEIMEDLLSFLYTGSIDLTPDNVHSVCVAAHFLQIADLLKPSVEYLCQLISVDSVLSFFVFSLSCELEPLRDACLPFIASKNVAVFQNRQILTLSNNDFKELIAGLKEQFWNPRTNLRVNTFDCIVRWTEANLSERLDELPGLLKSIPLEELPHDFLTGTVSIHPLVKGSTSSLEAVSAALENYQAVLKSGWRTSQNLLIFGYKKSENSNSLMFYDWLNESWKQLPDMLQPRTDFNHTVINGRDILISGGYYWNGNLGKEFNCEMFSWKEQTWKELAKFRGKSGWEHYSIGTLNGVLYAARREQDHRNRSKLPFYRYSFQTRKWKALKALTVRRKNLQLVGCGDYLYAFGDRTDGVEKYDPITDHWSVLKQSYPQANVNGAAVLHGKIYTFARYGDLLMFDPETGVWSSVTTHSTFHGFRNLMSMNDQLLVIDPDNDIAKFDFDSREWQKFCKMDTNFSLSFMVAGGFH